MTRADRYKQLLEEYPPARETSAEEDAANVEHAITTGQPLSRWALAHEGGDSFYIQLDSNRHDIEAYALDGLTDGNYPTVPREILDLDTGDRWEPIISIKWVSDAS